MTPGSVDASLIDPFKLEATYYDKIWGSDCNYHAEAKFLHHILKRYGVHHVLDLACGTGLHCIELAKLGYCVVGLDISQTMLGKARKNSSRAGIRVNYILGDMTRPFPALRKAKVALPFDAVTCMGNSLAHMLDDKMLFETLDGVRMILKEGGFFILWVNNAERIRDGDLRQLKAEAIVNDPNLQLALLSYNYRDNKDQNVLIWNVLWLINDHEKVTFQVRTHPLRFFRYNDLEEILKAHGFSVINAYSDTLGRESFHRGKHDTIFVICRKK